MAEARFYTYLHRRADTGEVFYVGKGQHKRAYSRKNRNMTWHDIANAHGFTHEIVKRFDIDSDALAHERSLIAAHLAAGATLANRTRGGQGCARAPMGEEQKAKISASLKGQKPSAATIFGSAAARRGVPLSDEVKAKISAARKGKRGHIPSGPLSADVKTKISATMKRRWAEGAYEYAAKRKPTGPLSAAHRAKLSVANKGRKLPPFTESHRAKMSESRLRYFERKRLEVPG